MKMEYVARCARNVKLLVISSQTFFKFYTYKMPKKVVQKLTWLQTVKKVRAANPKISYKKALQLAKKVYKK